MEQSAIPSGYPINNFSGYEAYPDGRVVRLSDSKEMHPNKKGVITLKSDSGELEEVIHAELISAINAAIESAKSEKANDGKDVEYVQAEKVWLIKSKELAAKLKSLQLESMKFSKESDRKADDFFIKCGKYSLELTELEEEIALHKKTHPKFAKGKEANKAVRAARNFAPREATPEEIAAIERFDKAKVAYDEFLEKGKELKKEMDDAKSLIKSKKKFPGGARPGNLDNLGRPSVKNAFPLAAAAVKASGIYVSQKAIVRELNATMPDGTPKYDVALPVSDGRISKYLRAWKINNPDEVLPS